MSSVIFGPLESTAKKRRILADGEYKNTSGRKCAYRAVLRPLAVFPDKGALTHHLRRASADGGPLRASW